MEQIEVVGEGAAGEECSNSAGATNESQVNLEISSTSSVTQVFQNALACDGGNI